MTLSSRPYPQHIAITPYKVSLDDMEILVGEEAAALKPGQLLCFEGDGGEAVYGRLEGIRQLSARPAGRQQTQEQAQEQAMLNCRVKVILGEPDFTLHTARVLDPVEMGGEVQAIQGVAEYPLQLGPHFEADFLNLDTLTVVEGASLLEKARLLRLLIPLLSTYQRLVIVDPLGVLQEALLQESLPVQSPQNPVYIRAGLDVGLSLQSVGLKRFLEVLSQMLPEIIRAEILQWLAGAIPLGQTFYAFKELLFLARSVDANQDIGVSKPGNVPLLNCLYEIDRLRVFADSPREVFSLQALMANPVTVVDLSALIEPWKTLFYEEVCLELLGNAGGDILPVLIYPENYLPAVEDYVRKANEAELAMVVLASPYLPSSLLAMADNRFHWNVMGDILLEGSLTFGLPVCLSGLLETESQILNENQVLAVADALPHLQANLKNNPSFAVQSGEASWPAGEQDTLQNPGALQDPSIFQDSGELAGSDAPNDPGYTFDADELLDTLFDAEESKPSMQTAYEQVAYGYETATTIDNTEAYQASSHVLQDLYNPVPRGTHPLTARSSSAHLSTLFDSSGFDSSDDPDSSELEAASDMAGKPDAALGTCDVTEQGDFDSILGPLHELGGVQIASEPLVGNMSAVAQAPGGHALREAPVMAEANAYETHAYESGANQVAVNEIKAYNAEDVRYAAAESEFTTPSTASSSSLAASAALEGQAPVVQPTLTPELPLSDDEFNFDIHLGSDGQPVQSLSGYQALGHHGPDESTPLVIAHPLGTPTVDVLSAPEVDITVPATNIGDDFSLDLEPSVENVYGEKASTFPNIAEPMITPEADTTNRSSDYYAVPQPSPESYDPGLQADIDSSEFSQANSQAFMAPEPPPIIQRSPEPALEQSDYQVGDRVQSDKYGEGVVQKLIPMEMAVALHVLFDNGAKRTIVPSPASLQKI